VKTIEQIKGELMYMLLANGYEQYGSSVRVFNPRNDRSYDLDTLDGIAAMMPEGWGWEITKGNWWTDMTGGSNHVKAVMHQATAYRLGEKYEDESGGCIVGEPCANLTEAFTRMVHAVLSAQAARTEVGRG